MAFPSAQYTADAEKYNTYMPYHMVIPQEEDHVRAIERLFAAYASAAQTASAGAGDRDEDAHGGL